MDRTRRELVHRIRIFGLQTLGSCERFFSLSDQKGFENLHSWPEHPQNKGRLDTRISGKVRIPKGCAMFFKHSIMRGGCSCNKENCRIFFKVGYYENKFPCDIDGDLQLVFKCQFCSKLYMKELGHRSHARICKNNPDRDKNRETKNKKRRKEYLQKKREEDKAKKGSSSSKESNDDELEEVTSSVTV